MFAVNRFFAKVQLFLQNTYCLQHFFLHKPCGALVGRVRKKVAGKEPAVRVRDVGQRARLSEMQKNYAGSDSELIKN